MKTMTPEEQRITIALACGAKWRLLDSGYTYLTFNFDAKGFVDVEAPVNPEKVTISSSVPDYLGSLDAMHEAVMGLDGADQITFASRLYNVAVPEEERFADHFVGWPQAASMLTADATKWAEAFLRTIGKWNTEALRLAGEEV